MTKELELAPGVTEPLSFITQSTAILGKKGSGKTSAGVVIVEEVYSVGVPFVVVDPKGDWYGLRARADGTPGIPVPIFGGLHADVPLEPGAGKYVADLLRGRRLSAVLDVSEFSIGERAKFLAPFAEAFYRFDSKEPMMLVLEEAHEYIPQQAGPDEKRMLGNFERLVKLGRWKGLGVVMMTQRSASLNKNVLTQADNLLLMQTTSPQDRLAAKGWIETAADGLAADILSRLPGLQPGEVWIWQPGRGAPFQFRFRKRWTYDAGATPEVGVAAQPTATLADVDLTAIAAVMAETIEKAKADDPKVLRARIAELERHLRDRAPEKVQVPVEVVREVEKIVEIPLLTEEEKRQLADIESMLKGLVNVLPLHTGIVQKVLAAAVPAPVRPPVQPRRVAVAAKAEATQVESSSASLQGSEPAPLGKAARTILTVLATYGPRTHVQLAILSGYSSKSGGFRNTISAQRTSGHLEGTRDSLSITDAGLAALGEYDPLPTGQALIDHWKAQVGQQHRAILDALLAVYPASLTQDEVAEITGYQATSGGFRNSVSKLRTLELIHGGRDALTASDTIGEARDA